MDSPVLSLAADDRFDLEGAAFIAVFTVVCLFLTLVMRRYRRSRFLSLSPRVHAGEGFVIARTARRLLVASLGLLNRAVIADRAKQTVTIRSRRFWLFRRDKKIPFDQIEKVVYDYGDLNPATAFGMTGNSTDTFSVKLRLIDGDIVHLFHFNGGGGYTQGWDTPDWLSWTHWWQRLVDVSGTQEEDSREFVKHLERVLGARPAGR